MKTQSVFLPVRSSWSVVPTVFLGAGEHLTGGKVEIWTETAETGWRRETRLENAGAAFPFHGSSFLSSFPGMHKSGDTDLAQEVGP